MYKYIYIYCSHCRRGIYISLLPYIYGLLIEIQRPIIMIIETCASCGECYQHPFLKYNVTDL